MKFTYRCAKCDSRDVIEIVGSNLNQHQKIPLHPWNIKNAVLNRYVCASCGYTEEYVQLSESFKKWARQQLRDKNRRQDDYV